MLKRPAEAKGSNPIYTLRDFDLRRYALGGYLRKWVVLGVLIGIVAGFGAIIFYAGIQLAMNLFLGRMAGAFPPLPAGEGPSLVTPIAHRWLLPAVTTLGGLISGLIVFTLAPEAEGHGTDAAIAAFHRFGGRFARGSRRSSWWPRQSRSDRAEAPGVRARRHKSRPDSDSWLGEILHLEPADRRIAVVVGMGAGIGAIFKAPLGGGHSRLRNPLRTRF